MEIKQCSSCSSWNHSQRGAQPCWVSPSAKQDILVSFLSHYLRKLLVPNDAANLDQIWCAVVLRSCSTAAILCRKSKRTALCYWSCSLRQPQFCTCLKLFQKGEGNVLMLVGAGHFCCNKRELGTYLHMEVLIILLKWNLELYEIIDLERVCKEGQIRKEKF